jgi:sulfonate transport system substrate-binding protein
LRSLKTPILLIAGVLALTTACGSNDGSAGLRLDAALPTSTPKDTTLTVSADTTKVALEASGEKDPLPFKVSWASISYGPDVIQAFRGGKLDLNAGDRTLPPAAAKSSGLDVRIVGVEEVKTPGYEIVTAPGSGIHSVADLRGKKVAVAPGQGTGLVMLRALQQAGIGFKDVKLVELTSTQNLAALQGKQVDAAVLGITDAVKYLKSYQRDGAVSLGKEYDLLRLAWAPVSVLKDPKKLPAVRQFVQLWAREAVWAKDHPTQWRDAYYVKDQGLTPADADTAMQYAEDPYFPESWDAAIKWEQDAINLVSEAGWFGKGVNASDLFDKRFEKVAADAVPKERRLP